MELGNWVVYLLAVTGLTLTPGPNGLLALTHGAIYGRRRTLSTIFGGSIGFATVIALSMSVSYTHLTLPTNREV